MKGPANVIFSFLDESSVAAICGGDADDIANLNDVVAQGTDPPSFIVSLNSHRQLYMYHGSLDYPHRD